MSVHLVSFYETFDPIHGCEELQDLAWCCSGTCESEILAAEGVDLSTCKAADEQARKEGGGISWGAYPCGEETDSDVYCANCESKMWDGLEQD